MLRTDTSAIEAVIHPSFSRFFEAPYCDRIPFQDGPEISFNGEVSTFLSIPIKRNDRPLPVQVASGPHPPPPGTFMSLLKSKSKASGPGGPLGGLKISGLRYLDFKRALLPSMLAAVRSMHSDALSAADKNDQAQALADAGSPDAPSGRRVGRGRGAQIDLHTNPAAQSDLLLADVENQLYNRDPDEEVQTTADPLQEEEERLRQQLLRTTGLLLPTETQWYLLNELRIHAGAPERSEQGIDKLSHYYAQLLYLEPKFPFETDEIQMNFTWYEAFFPDRKVVTNCIQYEKASVLFNIAAVYTTLASSQSMWTPDGKKKAAAYFQKGAGVLYHIRDRLCARLKPRLDRASELSEPTLTAAAELMLAQAMECFYEKANDSKASSGVTAKIAAQTSDYYEVAHRAAKAPTGICKCRFPETWTCHIKAKTHLFTAIAHMHTTPHSIAEAAIGERIARVGVAKEAVEMAVKCSKEVGGVLHELVQGHAKNIATAHSFLIHANFERHHHPTYDTRLLPPLKRPLESLVIATPLDQAISNPENFMDMFHAIMSPANHTGVKHILEDCRRKVDVGVAELTGCLMDIDGTLASLGLSLPAQQPIEESGARVPTPVPFSIQPLHTQAAVLLQQVQDCTRDEDAFAGVEMIDCLEKVVRTAEGNLGESFDILNNYPPSTTSTHLTAIRAVAVSYNTRVMEAVAQMTDLKRKWDSGIGDIASYNEDDIRALLPEISNSQWNRRTASVKRELESLLRRIDGVRRMCEDKIAEIQKLEQSMDKIGPESTSVSIDMHTAIQSRHEQLRVAEEAVRVVKRDKEILLTRIEELSAVLDAATKEHREEEEARQMINKLLAATARYIEWKADVGHELQASLKVREDTCRLLARCLRLPRHHGGSDDQGAGGFPEDSHEIPPPPPGVVRDPMLNQFLHEDHIRSGDIHTKDRPSTPSAQERGASSPVERPATPNPLHQRLVALAPTSLSVPPYNPDVVPITQPGRFIELRSALAASGIEPSVHPQPRRPETSHMMLSLPTIHITDADNDVEDSLRSLLKAQQDKVARLMAEKAERDLALNRLQEKLQLREIERREEQGNQDDQKRLEPPRQNLPYHPLNAVQKGRANISPLRRKPAIASDALKTTASDPKAKNTEGRDSRPYKAPGTIPGADKIKQILRFVGMKSDVQGNMLESKGSDRSKVFEMDATSRKTSYATAYDRPIGGRIFSTASRTMGTSRTGLKSAAFTKHTAPNFSDQPADERIQDREVVSAPSLPSQPSFIEHPTVGETPADLPFSDIALSDYHYEEEAMADMLPLTVPDASLPARVDDIYAQIRALILSQDALRSRKEHDMREALATILKSHNSRIGGVEDAMSRWTRRKMEDARNRLTDALRRCEREEKRNADIEREAGLEQYLKKQTDKVREEMRRKQRERIERSTREREREIDRAQEGERKIRDLVEHDNREAEIQWGETYSRVNKARNSYSRATDSRKEGGYDKRCAEDQRGIKAKGKEKKRDVDLGHSSEENTRSQFAEMNAEIGNIGRIERWVEEQRRMSVGSSSGNRQTLKPGVGMRATCGKASYERIASAAAAAAAAGVSAAFQQSTQETYNNPSGHCCGKSQEGPNLATSGKALPRRDAPAIVKFNVHGQPELQAQHKIKRKPSGGVPVPYTAHDEDGAEHQPHGEGFQAANNERYDVDVVAAAAAEPIRRGSSAPPAHYRSDNHRISRDYDTENDYKKENDFLAREFAGGAYRDDDV